MITRLTIFNLIYGDLAIEKEEIEQNDRFPWPLGTHFGGHEDCEDCGTASSS